MGLKFQNMSNRLDKDREAELQPERMAYAKQQLEATGVTIDYIDATTIIFTYKGHKVTLYPYSGWHTGKSIVDGRGIGKLLKQLI